MKTVEEVLTALRKEAKTENIESQKRFGINISRSLGLSVPQLRVIAKKAGKNHTLALELWKTNIHEARHIAAMIADPKKVTVELMDSWAMDFNSWDIVDGCCGSLFRKTPFAYSKAMQWCGRKEEFVRRAGFSLMAMLAVHDKKVLDKDFEQFFPYIYKYSNDERNFVKKAVNWSLRQIGKRNEQLCKKSILLAKKIKQKDDSASRWVAAGVLRELETYLAEGRINNIGVESKKK